MSSVGFVYIRSQRLRIEDKKTGKERQEKYPIPCLSERDVNFAIGYIDT